MKLTNLLPLLLSITLVFDCAKKTIDWNELYSKNPQAKELNLSLKEIGNLPPDIGKFESLESLDLRYGSLVSLPSEIGKLQNLKKLNLLGNQLTHLPPEICQLKNLEVLLLGANRLSSLPSCLADLQNLQVLSLDKNPIPLLSTDVDAIGKLSRLEILDLSENKQLLQAEGDWSQIKASKILLYKNSLTKEAKVKIRESLPKTQIQF